jgi:hypothetical protein
MGRRSQDLPVRADGTAFGNRVAAAQGGPRPRASLREWFLAQVEGLSDSKKAVPLRGGSY